MIVKSIKTIKVRANERTIFELLDEVVKELPEKSILAITSKVISLCEGRVVPVSSIDKAELVKQEAEYYLPKDVGKYHYSFAIKNNTLSAAAGIDESNGDGNYVLWPSNPQKSANDVRKHLRKRFKLGSFGVVITDSTSIPFRVGTLGIALGYSGFAPLHDYIGQPDLFGRPFQLSRAGLVNGLAAAAVLVMGEGTEQTPMALISDVDFIEFKKDNPSPEEIKVINIPLEEDIYEPFISRVKWLPGQKLEESDTS